MNVDQKKTGSDCYNDFVRECHKFYDRMKSEYEDIIEFDSPCIEIKKVVRKCVPTFNPTNYNIQSSPIREVSIKFDVFAYGENLESNNRNNSSRKLITEWISTDDDLPCNHPEMCYEVSVKGYMFTDIVLVHTKDNSIFTCNMKKGPDGSFIWNVLPKSIVITHWAKYPNLIDMMLNK